MQLQDVMYLQGGSKVELFANMAGFGVASRHPHGAFLFGQEAREVRCYPPISRPPSSDLAPLAQIAQHAERLFAEVLSHAGEAPPVEARVICGDETLATLRLRVGPCSPLQAYRATCLVEPLNEGRPSTHLLQGRISGAWRIDKVEIVSRFIRPYGDVPAPHRHYCLRGPDRDAI